MFGAIYLCLQNRRIAIPTSYGATEGLATASRAITRARSTSGSADMPFLLLLADYHHEHASPGPVSAVHCTHKLRRVNQWGFIIDDRLQRGLQALIEDASRAISCSVWDRAVYSGVCRTAAHTHSHVVGCRTGIQHSIRHPASNGVVLLLEVDSSQHHMDLDLRDYFESVRKISR